MRDEMSSPVRYLGTKMASPVRTLGTNVGQSLPYLASSPEFFSPQFGSYGGSPGPTERDSEEDSGAVPMSPG